MFRFGLSLNRVLKRIERADALEIDQIVKKLIYWQNKNDPKYEMVVMTLPKDDLKERERQIDLMASMLKKYVAAEQKIT